MTGIILYGSFELAPYSKKYMRILEKSGEKFDLIGWRREEIPQYKGENVYMYGGESAKRYSSPVQKIKPALGYRRYVKGLIRRKKYDRLIILTTQTALILADVLLTKYKNKYIFDYRDKSYEYLSVYRAAVNSIIKNSTETVISSPWFAQDLTDKKEYIKVHNFQNENLKFIKNDFIKKKENEKIIVGYVGALRAYDYHKQLIDMFANDKRFEFHTYGCGDDVERLAEYASRLDNIHIFGAYKESDKYNIIDTFDMMCYNYPYSFVNDVAVANKYYDSLIMKKPMFTNTKTRIGRFVRDNSMGIAIDQDEDIKKSADKIYDWYRRFDTDEFVRRCSFYLDGYTADNERFEDKITEALNRR